MDLRLAKMPRLEDLPRITRQQFFEDFDGTLERVGKEKTAILIEDEKQNYVLCPVSLLDNCLGEDHCIVMTAAVKYAVGAGSDVSEVVCRFIAENMTLTESKTLKVIAEVIDNELNENPKERRLDNWSNLRSAIKTELGSRNDHRIEVREQ